MSFYLNMGCDSPVREDSFIRQLPLIKIQSQAILLLFSIRITSPGTRASIEISYIKESLLTLAFYSN
jgi:hypothetical protein